MIQSGTTLTSSGFRDWLVQRATSVILGVYFIFLLGYFFLHPHLTYEDWRSLHGSHWMKLFNFLALISLVGHAWVGIWTVLTDYIKPAGVRLLLELLMVIALLSYLVWGVEIFWQL